MQEWRPRDGAVEPRDVSRLGPQLLGDHCARDSGAVLTNAVRPLQRRLTQTPRAIQGEPLGDVLGVAVGDPCERSPARQRSA